MQLYIQGSSSVLTVARSVSTPLPTSMFPALFHSPTGLSMRFEVEPPPIDGVEVPQPESNRLCNGVAIISVFLGHPRFAALREAEARKVSLPPGAFGLFNARLTAASHGLLGESEAKDLVTDLIEHTLRLANVGDVRMDERVRGALEFMDANCSFDIAEIAGALKLSVRRLSILFKEQTGVTFRERVLRTRTMWAWEAVMLAPELSLTEIAHKHGFADLAHMSRAFRNVFHVPPSQFREPRLFVVHGRPELPGHRFDERWPSQGHPHAV
jgi:AraC-like DNA-binding protein